MLHLSFGLAVTLVAGLAGGVVVDRPIVLPLSLSLAGGWLATTVGFFGQRPRVQFGGFLVSVFAAGWLLGGHAVDRAIHPPLRTLLEQRFGGFAIEAAGDTRSDDPIVIEGRLREDAALTDAGAILRIDVERIWIGPCPERAEGGVSVGVGGSLQGGHLSQWTAGRVIRAPALLRRPARYLNEGLSDQERALARRGVALVGAIKSAALVEVVGYGRWWEELAARLRALTRAALVRHLRPGIGERENTRVDWAPGEHAAAIATAILIGDRAGLDVEIERRMQEAGTYHVIAISGGNIAILAGLMLATLASVGLRGRIAALIAIASLTAYALIAAGGASVARATLMAVVYLAVRVIDQRTAAANAIGLSAAVLLLTNPLSVADVGFWLTFGATGAIIIGATNVPLPAGSLTRAGMTVLIASACAELVLAPIGALVFQRVTFAGLILNFVALPAMTVVQVGAMVVVTLDTLGLTPLARWAGHVVHLGSMALTESTRFLDLAPWLTWRVPSPSVAVVALYYLALSAVFATWHLARTPRVLRLVAISGAATLFLWVVASPQARVRALGDGRLHLSLVDVGQGDSMAVTFPNGRRLVVDTGGISPRTAFDIGDRIIGPSLRARDVLHLDYLAVTHGDPDHVGGARSLIRDFQPAEVWWGVPVANHEPEAVVRAEAMRARSAWRTLQRGDRLEVGGVEIRIHHPPLADWERQRVRNDDSLVMELRFGEVSLLLTGDISRDIERDLLPTLDLLPVVVLKVAHHGSGTSSAAEFVEHVKPRVAVIGVGRANPYGHPVPPVLERLQRAGTEVFRTDSDGQIDLTTDGRSVSVRTWTGRRVVK